MCGSMGQNTQLRNGSIQYNQKIFDKRENIIQWKKTVFPINDTRTIGQCMRKHECRYTLYLS